MATLLKISEYKSSDLNVAFKNKITEISLPDKPFSSGSFGEVYNCIVNGHPQVIKFFYSDNSYNNPQTRESYQTILKFQDAIINRNHELRSTVKIPIEEINALQGLPQFSFSGTLDNGAEVYGYSANYLDAKDGWILFQELFESGNEVQKRSKLMKWFYKEIDMMSRLQFLRDLTEGFKELEKMKFVYADLNPHNFFINTKTGQLCLIDYDSGGVNKEPQTIGKAGDFLAPELINQERNTSNFFTDYWSLALVIHFFFFPLLPLFYLKGQSKKSLQDYFNQYQYPDYNIKLIEKPEKYKAYIEQLNNEDIVPAEIKRAFISVFNKGVLSSGARLTSSQWFKIINGLIGGVHYKAPANTQPISNTQSPASKPTSPAPSIRTQSTSNVRHQSTINQTSSKSGTTAFTFSSYKNKFIDFFNRHKKAFVIAAGGIILIAGFLFWRPGLNSKKLHIPKTSNTIVDLNNLSGTYTVQIVVNNEKGSQMYGEIEKISENDFSAIIYNDNKPANYSFVMDENNTLKSRDLGIGKINYDSVLDKITIEFQKDAVKWIFTR